MPNMFIFKYILILRYRRQAKYKNHLYYNIIVGCRVYDHDVRVKERKERKQNRETNRVSFVNKRVNDIYKPSSL